MQLIKIDPLPSGQLEVKMLDPENPGWNRKLAYTHEDLKIQNARLREALELIAAPQRSDGTWNRDRAACQKLAEEALK